MHPKIRLLIYEKLILLHKEVREDGREFQKLQSVCHWSLPDKDVVELIIKDFDRRYNPIQLRDALDDCNLVWKKYTQSDA
jgi:hypothetical protein